MRHIKKINELFDFLKKDELKKYYGGLADKFDIHYEKTDDRTLRLGPKNGHEITVSIGADVCNVRPSYYGTYYKGSEIVKDLEEYLANYDFNYKPKVSHKFNYEVFNEDAGEASKQPSKDEFVDEVLDMMYLNGSKEDGKYILTLAQATQVAKEIYKYVYGS